MHHTVTLEVCSRNKTNARFVQAFSGKAQGTFISFDSPALLFKVISGKRWELLKLMTGAEPMAMREIARRAKRDVKAVHSDIHALLDAGILQKTDNGQITFPYDTVHVDFMLKAA